MRFGKSDRLTAVVNQIQERGYRSSAELDGLLQRLARESGFKPKKNLWMLSHPEPRVRSFVLDELLRASDRSTADTLVSEMIGKPQSIRRELARLVAEIAAPRLPRFIGPLIHARTVDEREVALDLLEVSPKWYEMSPQLKDVARDPSPIIRKRTVSLLGEGVMYPQIRRLLFTLIHEPHDEIRHAALETLGKAPAPDLIEPFFERLAEEPPPVRASLTRTLAKLARHPDARFEERLLPMLADENPVLREAAVDLLREHPDGKRVLRAYLLHSQGQVSWLRERSQQSILKFSRHLVEHLLELMDDSDDEVRVAAMIMASHSRDPRVIAPTRRILHSDADWWIRSLAAEVLSKFEAPQVLQDLLMILEDDQLKFSAIAALGVLGDPQALRPLLLQLEHPNRGIRSTTLDALERFDDIEAMDAIFRVARDDADDTVRDKAVVALSHFGPKSEHLLKKLDQHESFTAAKREAHLEIDLEMENDALNSHTTAPTESS